MSYVVFFEVASVLNKYPIIYHYTNKFNFKHRFNNELVFNYSHQIAISNDIIICFFRSKIAEP